MSNISTLLFWLAVNYVPADSSFTGMKMFTVTLETAVQLYVTPGASIV